MEYTLEELVKSYYTDKTYRDVLEGHIKILIKEGKEPIEYIEDLEKEKELLAKKVKIVEYYFTEDIDPATGTGGTAPIRQYISDKEYEVCDYRYIQNITDRLDIAEIINISKHTVSSHIFYCNQKLRKIKVEI